MTNNVLVLQNCTIALTAEHNLCNQTAVQSAEEDRLAVRRSSIKEKPEVSPQTSHQYIGLLSVILPFCLPAFTHKSAHNVNGNGLYIFRECVKCEG
jgi:hypothetical protein